MRILVVEDEKAIADFLERGLRAEGYSVTTVSNGREGEAQALTGDFDLLLLDLMLPERSGLDVLGVVRKADPRLPIIVLTARGEVEHRIQGLDSGATDYVTKPFSFAELAARIRAHLRRPDQGESTSLSCSDIRLDLLRRSVQRSGSEIRLSAKEFDLLAYFMRHPGQVLSREQLLNGVWGYDYDPGTNVVGVYVAYLRRKLGTAGPDPIETMRSVGYRLRDDL